MSLTSSQREQASQRREQRVHHKLRMREILESRYEEDDTEEREQEQEQPEPRERFFDNEH